MNVVNESAAAHETEAIVASSGNVFEDIGLPNAEDRAFKATLVRALRAAVERQKLTQTSAAQKAGFSQPDLSRVLRGIVSNVSSDRLIRALNALGQDVNVKVSPRRDEANVVGRTLVLADVA